MKFYCLSLLLLGCLISCRQQDELVSTVDKHIGRFDDSYASEQVSTFLLKRYIYSHDVCKQIQAVFGFARIRKDRIQFFTTDALISDFLYPGSKRPIDVWDVQSQHHRAEYISYLTGYHNFVSSQIWNVYRNILEYSPLNRKTIDYFDYELCRDSLLFSTKEGAFPSKVHFDGDGLLMVDDNGILEVAIHDVEFYHGDASSYSERMLISPYDFEAHYIRFKGKIYLETLSLIVRWDLPDIDIDTGTWCYSIEDNPYRDPFKNKMSTKTTLQFGLPHQGSVNLDELMIKSVNVLSYYTDHPDIVMWHSLLGDELDRAMSDLGVDDEQLVRQTVVYARKFKYGLEAASGDDYDEHLNNVRKKYAKLFAL